MKFRNFETVDAKFPRPVEARPKITSLSSQSIGTDSIS